MERGEPSASFVKAAPGDIRVGRHHVLDRRLEGSSAVTPRRRMVTTHVRRLNTARFPKRRLVSLWLP